MIGKKLRDLRKQHNLTQNDLAKKMKRSVKSIKNWEADLSTPSLSSFLMIIEIFHVSADELLGRSSVDTISIASLCEQDKLRARKVLQAYFDLVQ